MEQNKLLQTFLVETANGRLFFAQAVSQLNIELFERSWQVVQRVDQIPRDQIIVLIDADILRQRVEQQLHDATFEDLPW